MQRINYHHLYYFYTIARRGSIAEAGKELLLAQPTLSTQLKQFEGAIGRSLFDRVGKRLVLTDEGHEVLRYAESIFRLGQELEDSLRDRPRPGALSAQFGVALGIPKAFSHALLSTALKEAPGAHVECREAALPALLDDLRDYRLDAVLSDTVVAADGRGRLRHHIVGRIPVVIAARPALAKKIERRGALPKALDGAPLILPQAPEAVTRQLQAYFARHNVRPDVVADVQDVETARRLALEGFGAAPMNLHTLSVSKPARGLVVVGKPTGLHETLYLIEAADRLRRNPLARRLGEVFTLPKTSLSPQRL